MELFDGQSSKVFYQTFNPESPGEEPECVQTDSELGASSTRADQGIVDVILSGRVSAHSVSPLPFPFPSSQAGFQSDLHLLDWQFSGRIRISDGLVVLVRQPVRRLHAVSPLLTLGFV